VLVDLVSWRWIFFVNVPIAAVILILTPRALNESATTSGKLDVPGALTATGGMLALVYGLSNVAAHSWTATSTLVSLVIAGVLLLAFVLIETRTLEALMPLHIFANRNRSGVYAMMLCIGTAMFSMFFFLTQFLQNILGWSALKTGFGFLPMTLGIITAAVLASRLVGRIGIRVPLLVGPAAAVIGLELLTRLTIHSSYWAILVPLLIVSLGMGLSFVPLTLTAVSGVQPNEAGLASALLNTTQQVGGALGLAILSTIAFDAYKAKLASSLSASPAKASRQLMDVATTHGYTTAFQVGAFIALAGLLISALVIRTPAKVSAEATPVHAGL
jgi:predicted MFS family arabinose efflux permease